MSKLIKMLFGVLLLPVCIGAGSALGRVLQTVERADTVWIPIAIGAVAWVVTYLVLPRPMWLYVFGHEVTHAMWTWLFGGRVNQIKVSSSGGHVKGSKTNFLIALAPYFFPFYVVVVVILFLVARLALPWERLETWFLGCLGASYAFHLTLTVHILRTRQSDITEHGYLFSAAITFLGNVTVLLIGIPLLTTTASIPSALAWCWEDTVRVIESIQAWIV